MSRKHTKPDLTPPLDMTEICTRPALHVIPFGGLGEFGLNMMAYCHSEHILIVDCGGMFPDPSMFGIDMVIPDFGMLRDHAEHVDGVVLTHGHEDHIGAVAYFLAEFNVPVYGTPFTLELVKHRLSEHDVRVGTDQLRELTPGVTETIGPFAVTPLHVNHSISQAVSLAIDTPEGTIVHTGDFRIDPTPSDGEVFDFAGFSALGRKGVLALLSDSTNITRPGFTKSEREIAKRLDALIGEAESRIYLSLFSSAIPRIQEVLRIAERHGRKVCVAGRSLQTTTHIAREMGLLNAPDSLFVPEEAFKNLPPDQAIALVTGSQGEARSVLTRIAMNDHKYLRIEPGDTVIFSSRIIPGHERSVSNIINHLTRSGATIFTERDGKIHTSGHGHAGELETMLHLVKPRYFVPVHGEYRQLHLHRELAIKTGVPRENTFLIENGAVLEFGADGVGQVGQIATDRVFIDGAGVGEVTPQEVRQRRKIGNAGVVIALLVIRRATGELLYGPELISRGFIFDDLGDQLFDDAKCSVVRTLESLNLQVMTDLDEVKEELRLAVRRFFNRTLDRKPVVIPVVMEM